MSDIATKIAQLEALRPTFGAAWVDEQIAALHAKGAVQEISGVRQEVRGEEVSNIRQVIAANYYEAPPDEQHARSEQGMIGYLCALRHGCNTVQLGRIDPRDGRHHAEMRLEQVYIGLNTERQADMQREQPGDKTRAVPVLEAIGQPHPARLMLLGGPGSGKSTFVNHLALCLAGACLGERDPSESERGAALLSRLAPHWSHGALLPIRVVLRELAVFPPLRNASNGSLALLHAFLGHAIAPHAEALNLLIEALAAGRALLLFDGLDEVEAGRILVNITECISAVAGIYTRSPVLVTCRVLDYQANPQRQIPGFQTESLAPLDDVQINAFVDAWHAEIATTGRTMLGSAEGLRQALSASADLRAMARQPLLLTMMAVVHAGKGRLPDARALLYSECIELLLLRWRKEPDEPDLLAQLGLPDFKESDLIKVMARIGFAAHNRSAQQPEKSDHPADLSRTAVRDELDAAFTYYQPDEERRAALVVRLLNAIATRNGLLLKQSSEGGEVYTFPHRSFQEFMAGYHIGLQDDYDRLVDERASQVIWHESLRLMVSYQALTQAPLGPTLQVIRDLLGNDAALVKTLAGELLSLVGYARAAGYRDRWAGPRGWWADACVTLRTVSTAASDLADAPLRARAGMALGQICYGPVETLTVPGTTPNAPDPRLLDLKTGNSPNGRYWCPVEPGPFWYGDDRKGELQQKTLDDGFKIAHFTVTNAEYARFIAADGYRRQEWWTPEGWKFLQPGGHPYDDQEQLITLPRFWGDPDLNSPLQPVVGVSWYEAAAYCMWLTEQGHQDGWLPKDAEIRLPTSLEWERAARHTDKRHYPWGDDEPTAERANYDGSAIDTTAPIGCFPIGAAVCGAEDMVGNVCEWMCSADEQPERVQKDFTPDTGVLLSRSYFSSDLEQLCCGSRDWGDPYYGYDYFRSFRVIWSPRST